jgi:hypothetical protein
VSWDQRFSEPIILPGRKPLVTLRNAAQYIIKLPKAEHDAKEWQALLLVARSSLRCKVRSRLRAVFLLNEKIGYHRRM